MNFEALVIGCEFERICRIGSVGKIHSVFERALNIEVEQYPMLLFTIIHENIDMMSANLVVKNSKNNWQDFLLIGKNILLTSDIIYFDNKPIIKGVSNAQKWMRISNDEIRKMAILADRKHILNMCQEVENYLSEKSIVSMDFPVTDIDKFDPRDWIGLGYGLTPSGDDFLSGMLHGLHFMELLYGVIFLPLPKIVQEVSRNLYKTGAISQHFLNYALNSEWGMNTENFLVSLTCGEKSNIISAVDKKLSIGASSGYDELRGCLYGVKQYIRSL